MQNQAMPNKHVRPHMLAIISIWGMHSYASVEAVLPKQPRIESDPSEVNAACECNHGVYVYLHCNMQMMHTAYTPQSEQRLQFLMQNGSRHSLKHMVIHRPTTPHTCTPTKNTHKHTYNITSSYCDNVSTGRIQAAHMSLP